MATKKESKILQALRNNGRASLVTIGARTNMPKSTVFDKITRLNKEKAIQFTCLLHFEKLGFNEHHLFLIKANNKKQELEQYLSDNTQINNLYTSVEFDFIFETVSESENEIKAFLSSLMQKFPINFIQKIRLNKEICRENFWRDKK